MRWSTRHGNNGHWRQPKSIAIEVDRRAEDEEYAGPEERLRWNHYRSRAARTDTGVLFGQSRAADSAGRAAAQLWRRPVDAGGHEARLLSQSSPINHFHISDTPWFRDLQLDDKVTYITPRYEFGQPHLDGSALVFGRDLEETIANIARFSRKDAATFREWNRKAEIITGQILLPERFAEPLPRAEREALLNRTPIGREFLAICNRQPLEVVEELFENEHVRLLFLFKVSLFGTWLTDTLSKTNPMGSVIRGLRPADRIPALPRRLL